MYRLTPWLHGSLQHNNAHSWRRNWRRNEDSSIFHGLSSHCQVKKLMFLRRKAPHSSVHGGVQ